MIPRPPIPTLFPYTTLFRSLQRLHRDESCSRHNAKAPAVMIASKSFAERNILAWQADEATGGTMTRVNGKKARSDRKSTRLNSSHSQISYAVFCLKKKKKKK